MPRTKKLNGEVQETLEQTLGANALGLKKGRGRPSKQEVQRQIAAVKAAAGVAPQSHSMHSAAPVKPLAHSKQTDTVLGAATVLNPNTKVKIFQIYFKPEHKKHLDPAMVHLDNSGRKNHLLEYDVFRRLHKSEHSQGCDYWGAVSWKFPRAMGFGGATFSTFVNKNPGYDIYFCNPHPGIEGTYENLWMQGELSHPHFIELSSAFLKAAGLDADSVRAVVPSGFMASANYFVANHNFWNAYLQFVDSALQQAEKNLDQTTLAKLLSPVADAKRLHNGANYVPFIVERLLTEFLLLNHKNFKAIKVQSPKLESKMTEHHKSLRAMKDVAVRTKSEWLLNCWRNYRNLFLAALADEGQLAPYTKVLTNKDVKFADVQP